MITQEFAVLIASLYIFLFICQTLYQLCCLLYYIYNYHTYNQKRDIKYYQNIDKVYWECGYDIKDLFKHFERVPCLFVESTPEGCKILDIDHQIEFDDYRYTAWRKVLGNSYDIRVEVYLIKNEKLYTLKGEEIDFNKLGRSDIVVDKKFLGIMDIKKQN